MYYFIVNPASGAGRGRKIWKKAENILKEKQISYHLYILDKAGEATDIARAISSQGVPCTIVVVGGDGTINEVINGLRSFKGITFACIPTGSGNDFVRGLGIARDTEAALNAILYPKKICRMDIGKTILPTGEIYSYAVSTGMGYDASVCDGVQRSRVKRLLNTFRIGSLVYYAIALYQLLTLKRMNCIITLDDGEPKEYRKTYFAAAMNLPYEGGGFRFCPKASPADHKLDVILVENISKLKVLCLLPTAFFGAHTHFKGIHVLSCSKMSIRADRPNCVHTDGEIPGHYQEAIFTLHEAPLTVIVR